MIWEFHGAAAVKDGMSVGIPPEGFPRHEVV